MKITKILFTGIIMIFITSCQQQKDSTPLKSNVNTKDIKSKNDKIVFNNLDMILSPFEDMTEFALEKNESGILRSWNKVEESKTKGYFDKNMSAEENKLLNSKIENLKELIRNKNYSQIAIASTEIFEFNINNFSDANLIENQIRIEHLDYMGFKILALLDQDEIDWSNIQQTINKTQKIWLELSSEVDDTNLKDSFNYLFKGLLVSTKNKDLKMCEILANIDLTMVDVLENTF